MNDAANDTRRPVATRLESYVKLAKEIEHTMERLTRMCASMQSPVSSGLSGAPGGRQGDNMSRQLAIREEVEAKLHQMQRDERAEYRALEALVARLEEPDERQVIRLAYFDLLGWAEVAAVIYSGRSDYGENAERYLHRMFRTRKKALEHMEALDAAAQSGQAPIHGKAPDN